jgi:F0F1-type ATP synthase delta subunit
MARHYDPRYAKQRGDAEGEVLDTDSLTPEAVDALAARIEARISAGAIPARG